MASWKTIAEYPYKPETETSGYGAFKVLVQGNMDSCTILSARIRFLVKFIDSDIKDTTDGYYILYNPNNDPSSVGVKLIELKGPAVGSSNSSWIQNEDGDMVAAELTLPKDHDDEDYTIQDLWICNVGKGTVNTSKKTVTYASGTKTFNEWFKDGGDRKNYAARYSSNQHDFIGPVTSSVGKGTILIVDNGNNTFTVSGTKGAAGDSNPVKSYSVTYGYDSRATIEAPTTPVALTMTNTANATRTVWAKTTTVGTYREDSVASTSKAIRQYVAPSSPGVPVATASSMKLTAKENWNFIWVPAVAANTSSPIKGYRIRVYKNDSIIKGLTIGASGSITHGTGTNEWVDRESDANTLSLIPENLGFKTGDKIKIGISAYTRYSYSATSVYNTSAQLFNTNSQVLSSNYVVNSAGVMRVNVNGAWKEGQVYVNVNGSWKEAEGVYTNVNGSWKESI